MRFLLILPTMGPHLTWKYLVLAGVNFRHVLSLLRLCIENENKIHQFDENEIQQLDGHEIHQLDEKIVEIILFSNLQLI